MATNLQDYNSYIQSLADQGAAGEMPTSTDSTYEGVIKDLADQNSTLGTRGSESSLRAAYSQPDNLDSFLNQIGTGSNTGETPIGPVEAGLNASQMLMWQSLEAGAEATGLDVPTWLQERIDENKAIAGSADIEDFGDKLLFGLGQAIPPIGAAMASAVVAPFLGLSTALGVTIGGALTAMGMTQGDLQGKAKELDSEHLATLKQLGYGAVMAAPDAFLIGKAKHLMAPIKELVSSTTMESLKATRGIAGTTLRLGKDAATIGAAEGAQDIGTSVGANIFTGQDIDRSRVESIAKSAAEEAVIGGILGLPVSGMNIATANIANAQMEKDAELVKQIEEDAARAKTFGRTVDQDTGIYEIQSSTGELNEAAVAYVPTPNSAKNPGLFTTAFNALTGNITDPIKARHGDNKAVQTLMQAINLRPTERRAGRKTVADQGNVWKGRIKWKEGRDFWEAPKSEQDAAITRKTTFDKDNGNKADMNNPVDVALDKMLHGDALHDIVISASRGQINPLEKGSLWQDKTYFPISDSLSWESIIADPNWEENLRKGMQEEGKSDKSDSTVEAVKKKIEEFQKFGNNLSVADQKAGDYELAIRNGLGDALESGDINKIKSAIKKAKDESRLTGPPKTALTLDRLLNNAPQSWLESHKDARKTNQAILAGHIDKNMEHAAHMDKFGIENELFHELVARAIEEGLDKGNPLTQRDINGMYDALRVSQRQHLKPIDNKWRERQATAKALINTNLLGLSMLVSIPEILSIGLNTDIRTAIKSLGATMKFKDNRTYQELSLEDKAKVLVAAGDLNLSLNSAMEHVANRTNQDTANMRRWEQQFIRYGTGLPYMQHFLTTWAGKAMDMNIRGLVQRATDTKTTEGAKNRAIVELAEKGIDIEKATAWKETGFDQDHEYYLNEYLPLLLSQARDVIVDPDPVDKPAWQSWESLQLVSQLKGFMTVFTNRVMRGQKDKLQNLTPGAGNRELALKVAPYTTLYILAQMGIGGLREVLKSGEVDDEKTMGQRAWQSFGYLGSMAYFVDMANAMIWRSDPLASGFGPAASIGLQITGSTVRSIEAMDPDEMVNTLIKRLIPNTVGKGAVETVALEALGVE